MAITDTATKQKKELSTSVDTFAAQVEDAYALMYERLQGEIEAFTLAVEAMENPTAAQIKQLPQYKRLVSRAEKELDRFTVYLETVIVAAGTAGVSLGLNHSAALVNAMAGGFTSIKPAAMTPLLSYLDEAGALFARLRELTGSTVGKVVQAIIDGVGSGFNPRKIASLIQDAFGGGLTDALRNVRTVQIYSYRESARANYLSSDGIVTGWVWFAELDVNTCMSCVAQHGTIYPLEETLNDHYNGRCAALPYIPEFGNPIEQTGQAWFDGLPEAQQRDMMGAGKFEAYNAGEFEFSQLSKEQENDVYGKMRTETPLKDLVKGKE